MRKVRHDAIGDVVEIVVDVENARQRRDLVALDKSVSDGIAGRKAAGDWDKVAGDEFAVGLRLNLPHNVRDGHPPQGIAWHVAAGAKRRLEGNAANGRVLDGEFNDAADFVFIDVALNGGDDGDVEPDLRQPVEGAQFLGQKVRLTANDS